MHLCAGCYSRHWGLGSMVVAGTVVLGEGVVRGGWILNLSER